MATLTQFEFLRALGSALLNSLWQFGIFWILFRLLIAPAKQLSATLKHGVVLSFLSLGSVWFVFDIIRIYNFPAIVLHYSGASPHNDAWSNVLSLFQQNLPLLSLAYLAVVLVLFMNFARYFGYARKIRTQQLQKLGIDLRLKVSDLADRLGIERKVTVWLSGLIDTPMIIGFLKPTILLPLAAVNQLSVIQLEAILLHELAHIKRNDYFVNIYISTLKIIFFFNPFCRMLIESVRQEREKSCDDWVLQFRFDAHQYASALFQLESTRSSSFSLGIAAAGEKKQFLLERIQRILNVQTSRKQQKFSLGAYLFAVGIIAALAAFTPQKSQQQHVAMIQIKSSPFERIRFYQPKAEVSEYKTSQVFTSSAQENVAANRPSSENDQGAKNDNVMVADYDRELSASNVSEAVNLIPVSNEEERSYSIHTEELPEKPVTDEEQPAPFVPLSSFSFHALEDTSRPKTREETYAERYARESLVKTKKALTQIDWNRIKKELSKNGKLSKDELLKMIEASLEKLNWEKINSEVKATINEQTVERWRASLKAEFDEANKYKALQEQYQVLKNQLQIQQQQLKKDAEMEGIEVEKEIKKSKITVHL